jgi:methionine synthase I (cobalamin-dependent)
MPIRITQVEPGLYLNTWIGHITMDDVLQSEREGAAMMTEGETRVVLVNDLSDVTHLPVDLKALQRVTENNPQVIALLVVNAPGIVRLMGEAQAKLVKWQIAFMDDLERALEEGRALLRE